MAQKSDISQITIKQRLIPKGRNNIFKRKYYSSIDNIKIDKHNINYYHA